jgi:hypothetical protein
MPLRPAALPLFPARVPQVGLFGSKPIVENQFVRQK